MKQARADMVAAGPLFRILWRRRRQAARRDHPLPRRLFRPQERVPHGVTAHIIPWNYPAQMFGRTIAPALAVGNATVVKPAEDACLTPLIFAEMMAEVGFRKAPQHRARPWRGGGRGTLVPSGHRLHRLHRLAGSVAR